MLSKLVDIQDQLRRNPPGGPGQMCRDADRWGLVVHYNGPPVADEVADLALLQADARYHCEKDWSGDGSGAFGDGLMYHVAIGRDGTRYQCRDLRAVLWHCGAWPQNRTALSVLCILGGEQRATAVQLASLWEVAREWVAAGRADRSSVWGHRELSATSCPGTLMGDFVLPFRQEGMKVAEGFYFRETGHYVGGAFWQQWQAQGGLMVFGYPLTEEVEEGGRTVQYFERAVFEWHPENDPPYRVLLRRLGAEALARRAG